MLTRRTLLYTSGLALCAAPAFAGLQVPAARTLSFRIMRNGSNIGTHALDFAAKDAALTVTVDVQMSIGFGPIRFFHYNHHTVEVWNDGTFTSLDSKTDYDGIPAFCTVRRVGDGLTVEGSKTQRYTAPGNTLAATHWNEAELKGAMINPENGEILRPRVSDLGIGQTALASGAEILARHYSWRGNDTLDLWYDTQNNWAGLTALAKDGSELIYERM